MALQHRHEGGEAVRWHFFRAGGFDQVRLDSGKALLALEKLDRKLWAALSCPTAGLELDPRTLALIDGDGDGRIRADEVVAAVRWAAARLKDPGLLLKREAALPLEAIDDGRPEGAVLLAAARRILAHRGRAEAEAIALDDVADAEALFAATAFNGDGVVTPASAEDPFTAGLIADILAGRGGVPDRNGESGVNRALVEDFFADAAACLAWWRKSDGAPGLMAAGEGTEAAFLATEALAAKIEDYFTRCGLAAFDGRAVAHLNRSEEDWAALAGRLLSPAEAGLAEFPLALAAAGRPLPLDEGINPAWREAVRRFAEQAVAPLLGPRDALTPEDWTRIREILAPFAAWRAERPALAAADLGRQRIEAILASNAKAAILALIDRDDALAGEAQAIADVDRLLRYARDLAVLLDNFVAFRDFYTRKAKAVFQTGTLYLDGRSCELCVPVEAVDRHAALAALSRIYLVYCECRRRGGDEKRYIAAAVTSGDSDQLTLGRNGVFYDRRGGDWDATVVRIVDHPISIRQAFLAPYKKLGRLVGTQLEKLATARAASAEAHAAAALDDPKKAPPPGPATAQPFDAGRFAGIFATAGLALGAIGTAVASLVTGLLNLAWWQVPLAFAGLLAVVSGPSVAAAAFKLHQRHLGPILDANGWAVNSRARINIPFGNSLTELARLPPGTERALTDPFAEKGLPWRRYGLFLALLALLAILWRTGVLKWLLGKSGVGI